MTVSPLKTLWNIGQNGTNLAAENLPKTNYTAERKRELTLDDPGSATDEKRRKDRQILPKSSCIFCCKEDGHLHEFRTLDADANIRRMATDLQDTALLAKISGGDLIAIEAKYHLTCLTEL